jgi:hypothetical protein
MENGKKTVLVLLAVILLGAMTYVAYAIWEHGRPGAYLEGTVKIRYEDGTEVLLGSEDRQLFSLLSYWNKRFSVMTYRNRKVWGVSADIRLRFIVKPPDKSLRAQYWIIYWIEVEGAFFTGGRFYSFVTGFVDSPLNTYRTNKAMNKWMAKVGNPELSWTHIGSFVKPFYKEATSSIGVDLSTYISDPKSVTDALKGIPIAGPLADALSAHISSCTVKNGYTPLVVRWSMSGPDFYVRLKRSNFNGLSFHSGAFSIGAGEFARMWNGDGYKVTFKVGYFFRWKDVTEEFSPWKHGTVTIAVFDMLIQEGSWYVLSADVSGGVNVS